ncbi:hypothetical protein [Paenibacillus glycanilyticus]|uniref:HNH endonuclease 5 domain-containing protein n=1 Tax=Paenibacillus glycanilyticus TaxID=126569 RepID=A0ABQ6GCT5_9BACL|nr:hypothetical protein [Paenibacillus glycanilyticus]GLX68325.1 hypothetical protein MU1_26700 [Paenibacillus glycanilyticus]
MGRKAILGECHICGIEGKLSFEHVPPKSAFNDSKLKRYGFEQIFNKHPGELPTQGYKLEQKGAGGYTLCEKCNNLTGTWYADDFADWAYEGMRLLTVSDGNLSLHYPFKIFPLRVIKQIITMFFSVVSAEFRKKNFELEKFVLNKEAKYLPPSYKIYCSFMKGNWARSSGITGRGGLSLSGEILQPIIMSEIAFPPFVYVMTIDSPPPDERLTDITWFSRFEYDEFEIVYPKFTVLPINYYLPGDYRTIEQMEKDRVRNQMYETFEE